jgi:hypothetical protein
MPSGGGRINHDWSWGAALQGVIPPMISPLTEAGERPAHGCRPRSPTSASSTPTHWLPALKAACALCGLGNGIPSPPLAPATEEQRQAIAAILTRHGFPRVL